MLREKIIRAWKDPDYRTSLSDEDLADLPENPAGAIELTDAELDMAAGGSWGRSSSGPQSSGSLSTSQPTREAQQYSGSTSSNSTSNSSSVPAGSGEPTSMNPYTSRYPSNNSSNSSGYARWSNK